MSRIKVSKTAQASEKKTKEGMASCGLFLGIRLGAFQLSDCKICPRWLSPSLSLEYWHCRWFTRSGDWLALVSLAR